MATYPQFGGTSGVAELDVGQKGSTRNGANQARYPANVVEFPPLKTEVVNRLPQQGVAFVEVQAFKGQFVEWRGTLRVSTSTVLAAIRSDLSKFKDGQTITAGVRSAYNSAWVQPTKLTDTFGEILTTTAKLVDYRWGEFRAITSSPYFTIAVPLTLRFEVIR